MSVKETIKLAAMLTGDEAVSNALDQTQTTSDKDVLARIDLLTKLCNLVVNELSASYIPLKTTQNFNTSDGKIKYADLNENAVKITGVYDGYGNKLAHTLYNEYLTTARGVVTVEYAYTPANKGLTDQIGYTAREMSVSVLAYGVAAEFCLTQGRFDEAVIWRKRYSSGIEGFCLPENKRIKRRGWL